LSIYRQTQVQPICSLLLRHSTDPQIASSVYINADLSPAEARLAFEERQRKKEIAARRDSNHQRSAHPNIGSSDDHENRTSSNNSYHTIQQEDCSLPNNNENELPYRAV
jgi:hypothetical protein